mmetsp:Transcript_24632/g.62787  ORF Transcript_24632/g.62787 Transcript_24632/m.62787 type:complete len:204 (+) Transcript_24632:661-1272(+)
MIRPGLPRQPTLRSPHLGHARVQMLHSTFCNFLGFRLTLLVQQRQCRPHQHHEIHQPSSGLSRKREMLSAAFPHAPGRVVPLHETKRPIVHSAPADEAVVTVEIPLTVTNTKPIDHKFSDVAACLLQHVQNSCLKIFIRVIHLWIFTIDSMLNHQLQLHVLVAILGSSPRPAREQLQVAHPYKRRGTPAGDRARLGLHNVHGR